MLPTLSYCTNIHPSHSWEESLSAISENAPLIREYLRQMENPLSGTPLGLGLRLSAFAAKHLMENPKAISSFSEWMNENSCFVETINGFPYGDFYGNRIKETVFLPDWASAERVEYTKNLACILSSILPGNRNSGTISTVPISYGAFQVSEQTLVKNLDEMCGFLSLIEERSGKRIILGLEPEPAAYLDSTAGVIDFFKRIKTLSSDAELLEKHLGITYDTCHFAVMGESPSSSLSALENERIPVSKIQFSNALELHPKKIDELETLEAFIEPVYSHQTSIAFKDDRKPLLFVDLPEALTWARQNPGCLSGSRWCVHYHIPLFSSPAHPLENTNSYNEETVKWLTERQHTWAVPPQLEIETYTWSTLPEEFRKEPLPLQIAREMDWASKLLLK